MPEPRGSAQPASRWRGPARLCGRSAIQRCDVPAGRPRPPVTRALGQGQPDRGRPVNKSVRPAVEAQRATAGIGCLPGVSLSVSPGRITIPGSRIALATFSAGLQAARERMVWTDPGSLSTASVARSRGGGNTPRLSPATRPCRHTSQRDMPQKGVARTYSDLRFRPGAGSRPRCRPADRRTARLPSRAAGPAGHTFPGWPVSTACQAWLEVGARRMARG